MRTEHAELLASLDELRAIYPEATPRYLRDLGCRLIDLEVLGRTHFGGAHVLAWWLVQRCRPGPAPSRADVWLLGGRAAEGHRGPWRLQQGWSFIRLTGYVAGLGHEPTTPDVPLMCVHGRRGGEMCPHCMGVG